MKSQVIKIDMSALPEEAKREMSVFYQFLKKKYGLKKTRKKNLDQIDAFFDHYTLDLSSFKFDREEIHER
jgi:hypothetical protein